MNRIRANFSGSGKSRNGGPKSITLFLSLYLLVLAFFILLVSISSREDVKSKALMESLTSTFSSVLPPRMDLTAFNATTGEFLAADEFQRQVTGLFSTVVGVIKVEAIQPGRLMRIELDGDSLFELDQAIIREGQSAFMDRLVAALSSNPPGLRFELEFVVPTPWTDQRTMSADQSLPIQRAGAFARDMLARGAPPGAVSIGMKGSDAKTLEIWFHIRALEENRIRFEESPLLNVQPVTQTEAVVPAPAPVTLSPVQTPMQGVSGNNSLPIELPDPAQENAPISLQPAAPVTGGAQ